MVVMHRRPGRYRNTGPVLTLTTTRLFMGITNVPKKERESKREREKESARLRQNLRAVLCLFSFPPLALGNGWMYYVATARCFGKRRGLSCLLRDRSLE